MILPLVNAGLTLVADAAAGDKLNNALRMTNTAVGGALVVAGLLLAQIPWIDIAQAPGSDAFRLIQFHFILTGLISIWGSSGKGGASLIASFAMLALGVNAWIGFLAVTSGDSGLYWPLVFTAATTFNFLVILKTDDAPQVDPQQTPSADDNEDAIVDANADDGLVAADFGVVSGGGFMRGAFAKTGAVVLVTGLTIALLFFGTLYVTLLKRAIFDRADVSFQRLVEYFGGGAANSDLLQVVAPIIAVAIVMGALFGFEALLSILMRNRAAQTAPDIDRDLSLPERQFIKDAFAALLAYLDGKKYAAKLRIEYFAASVFGFALMFVAPFIVYLAEYVIGHHFDAARLSGFEPLLYSGPFYIGGIAMAWLAGPGLFWSFYQWNAGRRPDLAEYMFAQAGWNSINNRARTPDELLWVLVRHVRTRLASIETDFDPKGFLVAAFRERESLVYKSTLIVCALTFVIAAADLARFQLVDQRGVTYSRYFHFQQKHFAFADLDRIELRCMLFGPNDDGEVNLGLDYILVKDGEFRIDLLSDDMISEKFDRIEALDRELNALGVPVAPAPRAGFLQGDRPVFTPACADEIAARHAPEIAARLSALLRAGEFAPSEAPSDAPVR